MTCIHCGCTEERACIVIVDEQPQAIRLQIRASYRSSGRRPPVRAGCSWVSTNPPVCSAPACRAKFAEPVR